MVSPKQDFLRSFHNLKGITIGERRKNLFLLLNETELPTNLSELQPRTPLEEVFQVDVLLYFRRYGDLLEILKNENRIIINRILRDPFFIYYILENVTGEDLIDLFLNTSYNTKLKIMNKLSLYMDNETRGEEYFKAVEKQYGLYLASKLLPTCSLETILAYLSKHRIEITPCYLLIFIKKYPESAEEIIDKVYKQSSKVTFSKKYTFVFKYLIQNDSSLFLKIMDKYEPKICLGARATSAFVRKQRKSILANPKKCFPLLKKDHISVCLKEDFPRFYIQLLPKSIQVYKSNFREYLGLLKNIWPKAQRLELLLEAFSKTYYSELWDYESLVSVELIEMMNSDARVKWMQTREKPNSISELTWISFLKTEESVPKFKKLISYTTNVKIRANMIELLVRTCRINNDRVAFLDVFHYILEKHWNDHIMVHESFLQEVSKPFCIAQLGHKHWELLNKFLCFFKLQKSNYFTTSILIEYVKYCLNNNLPIRSSLEELVESNYYTYNICTKNPIYEKICLKAFLEILTSYEGEEFYKCINYVQSLSNWNKRHPRDKFPLYINEKYRKIIQSTFLNSRYVYYQTIACLLNNFDSEAESFFESLLKSKINFSISEIAAFLLKNHPLVFRKHLKDIVEDLIKDSKLAPTIIRLTRYYTHLDIPQGISQLCSTLIMKDCRHCVCNLLVCSSSPQQFLDFVPMKLNSRDVGMYKLQKMLLPRLHKIFPQPLALNCILHFCRGDYTKNIQRPLHSAFYNVNEIKLVEFVNNLNALTGPIRNQAISFGFNVLHPSSTYVLHNSLKAEKNPSIARSLFKGMFNMYLRNHDQRCWELAQECLKMTIENDSEVPKILSKYKRVPSQYLTDYILFAWAILDNYPKDDATESKRVILDGITPELVSSLPQVFSVRVIKEYFLKCNSEFQSTLNRFTSLCIIYGDNSTLKVSFEEIKQCVQQSWENPDCQKVRINIYKFVQEFCSNFRKGQEPVEVLKEFVTLWNSTFQPYEAYSEFLYLQFTLIISRSMDLLETGKAIIELINLLNNQSCFILETFCKSYKMFRSDFINLDELEDNNEENDLVILKTVIDGNNAACLSFVVASLAYYKLMTPKMKCLYDYILNVLLKSTEPVVQSYLYNYLKNLNKKNIDDSDSEEDYYL